MILLVSYNNKIYDMLLTNGEMMTSSKGHDWDSRGTVAIFAMQLAMGRFFSKNHVRMGHKNGIDKQDNIWY